MMGFREDSNGLLWEYKAVNNFEFLRVALQLLGRRQVAKTQDFDSCIRRFESSRPSQLFIHETGNEKQWVTTAEFWYFPEGPIRV